MNEDEPQDTATGEGMPERPEKPAVSPRKGSKAPAPAESAPEAPAAVSAPPAGDSGSTVRLVLAGPSWCTDMTFPQADGGTMVVTRAGLDVPADDADDLIETARRSGVRLTRSTE